MSVVSQSQTSMPQHPAFGANQSQYAYQGAYDGGDNHAPNMRGANVGRAQSAQAQMQTQGILKTPAETPYDPPMNRSASTSDGHERRRAPPPPLSQDARFAGPAINGTGMTFGDILPANVLGSAPPMDGKKVKSPSPTHSRFGSRSPPTSPSHGASGFKSSFEGHGAPPLSPKKTFKSAAKSVGIAAIFGRKSRDSGEVRGSYERVET
ncbi:unnamed protein product [Peniophora sp. CBMAI 1063]|nr:unnamed protein product [Peniophora sp. CBMAI 1063]